MKRLSTIMMCLFAMMAASLSAKAQEVTVTLFPGCTWISYPGAEVMDVATALGDFVPAEGDIIKSQYSSSIYRNGYWMGGVTHFIPGMGYKYYSNRTEVVSFVFGTPAPQLIVTTAEPSYITAKSAICGGSVTSADGSYVPMILRGVCWNTSPDPTLNDNYVEAENGLGNFTVSLTDLVQGTIYYVRAFAVTTGGTFYGDELSFTAELEFVDLGLPSGTLWATCNVGTDTPEGYGEYFAWGETEPKDYYYWSTYQYCNGSAGTLTKYCTNSNYGYNGFFDGLRTLLPEDDIATVYCGGDWRMPTEQEWRELIENTTHTNTTQNGVFGRLFTAANGNTLFLPAAGTKDKNGLNSVGSYGYYWSSSLYSNSPNDAWQFWFNSDGSSIGAHNRCQGQSVRPVRSSSQEKFFPTDN